MANIPLNAWQVRASPRDSSFEVTSWPDPRPLVRNPEWTAHAVSHDGMGRPLSHASQSLHLMLAFARLTLDGFSPDDVAGEFRKIAGFDAILCRRTGAPRAKRGRPRHEDRAA